MSKLTTHINKRNQNNIMIDLDDIYDCSTDNKHWCEDVTDDTNRDENESPRPHMLFDFEVLDRVINVAMEAKKKGRIRHDNAVDTTKPSRRRHDNADSKLASLRGDPPSECETEPASFTNSTDRFSFNTADSFGQLPAQHQHLATVIFYPSNFGPSSRGVLLIKAAEAKVVALVPLPKIDDIPVATFVGNTPSVVEALLASNMTLVDRAILERQTNNEIHKTIDEMAPILSRRLEQRASQALVSTDIAGTNVVDSFDRGKLLRKAFKRIKLPAGHPTDMYDMFESYLRINAPFDRPNTPDESLKRDHAFVSKLNTCLICFDHFPDATKLYQLHSCQHSACVDCWTAYIQSTVASRHSATLSCPAYKCLASIGLFDFPHILFGSDASILEQDAHTLFSKLVSGECIENCMRQNKGRHCSSPCCEETLIPVSGQVHSERGWNVMVCSCGTTLCVDCPRDTGSHPGISCVQYTKMIDDIESGRADAEYESYNYVVSNSQPCPRCGFAIQKDGGCNHMWCSKCEYYFCWQCRGPGGECKSFLCTKPTKLWKHKPEKDDDYVDLRHKVMIFRSIRLMRERLRLIDRATRSLDRDSRGKPSYLYRMTYLVLERQIVQAMIWLQSFLVQARNEVSGDEVCPPLQRLELIHAHLTRVRMDASEKNSIFTVDRVTAVMGMKYNISFKKRVYRHKKSMMESPTGLKTYQSYHDLSSAQQLQSLSKMSDETFCRDVQQAIEFALSSLLAKSTPPMVRRRRKTTLQANNTDGLNQKEERSKHSWKSRIRVDTSISTLQQERVVCWKGKTRVNHLRGHALDRTILAL